jgi:dUTP pyrophosphatase
MWDEYKFLPPLIKMVNKSPHEDPSYATSCDSGMDLRAWIEPSESEKYLNNEFNSNIKPSITLAPLERKLIHTGIYVEIPFGFEIQVRPKSGQALKRGLSVLNTPGTVDKNYRGEICVIAINLSNEPIVIEDGEKIAQMVVCPVCHESMVGIIKVDEIATDTERSDGGFGHTGTK